MSHQAIFSGRFDPMTRGHLDIISRAAVQFDRLIVAVLSDSAANIMPVDMRVQAIQSACVALETVQVMPFSGLLVDFAQELGVNTLVRGLRSGDDFQYEYRMAMMNQTLSGHTVETLFLMSSPEVSTISSTLVRQILVRQGKVEAFLPKAVVPFVEAVQWH